jgi:hypothetical protein
MLHVHGNSHDAHSVAVLNSLEGTDHREECSVCTGGGGEERKAILKVIFWFQ